MKIKTLLVLAVIAILLSTATAALAKEQIEQRFLFRIPPTDIIRNSEKSPTQTSVGECQYFPNETLPNGIQMFDGQIVHLVQSYRVFDERDIKCIAVFNITTPPQPLGGVVGKPACPSLSVAVKGDLAESLCNTLASALGSRHRYFNAIGVFENEKEQMPFRHELKGLEWKGSPAPCDCLPPQLAPIQPGTGGGAIQLEERDDSQQDLIDKAKDLL